MLYTFPRVRLKLDPDGKYYVPAAGVFVVTNTGELKNGWAYGDPAKTRIHLPYTEDTTGCEVATFVGVLNRYEQVYAVTHWLGEHFTLSANFKNWEFEYTFPDPPPPEPEPEPAPQWEEP